MNHDEAERILAALKSGQPLISRHKSAEALEWALEQAALRYDRERDGNAGTRPVPLIINDCIAYCTLGSDGTFYILPGAEMLSIPKSWRSALLAERERTRESSNG